jgi:hypothetical protein
VDSGCGYREECRKAVVHGVVAKVKTCQCHHFVFANGHEPRCIAHNWVSRAEMVKGVQGRCICRMLIALHALVAQRTVVATISMTLVNLAFVAALTQYRVAYIEHMTDPPLRPVSAYIEDRQRTLDRPCHHVK